ncbi:Structural maintenance of chromosome protein 1 [Trachipleistophora hominis]|uniref:Structural maintenance of chromosome protein 1 n=1 Tax=Trachipleistophora hominis TaxID=72359 RepID=L7JUX5_TRAHO|nr:Structural maintenance of chromosome protein 1 [Trachipleistophora hominis]
MQKTNTNPCCILTMATWKKSKNRKKEKRPKLRLEIKKIEMEMDADKHAEIIERVNQIREDYNILLYEFNKENAELIKDERNIRNLVETVRSNTKEIERLEKKAERNKALMKGTKKRIDDLKQKVDENTSNDLVRLKNRETELNEILGQFLRYKSFIKMDEGKDQIIKTLKALFPGVRGKLKNLLTVNQSRYVLPIEVLLGYHSQVIVTNTKDEALRCINYLEVKRLCRLTFFPIDSMKRLNKRTEVINGFVRAMDCISYSPDLQNIFECVFNDCYVILDSGLGRDKHRKYVTLDGTLFHKNALITGGPISVTLDHSIITELNEISAKINAHAHLNVILERIEEIKEENKIMCIEQVALENTINELRAHNETINSKNPYLNARFAEFDRQLKRLKAVKFKSILNGFSSIEELESFVNYEKIRARENEKKNLLAEFSRVKRELEHEIEELSAKMNIRNKEKDIKSNFERINKELKDAKAVFEEQRSASDRIVNEINAVNKELLVIKNETEKLENEKEEILQLGILEEIMSPDDVDKHVVAEGNIKEKEEELNSLNMKIEEIYATCSSGTAENRNETKELKELQKQYEEKKKESIDLRAELRGVKKSRLELFNEGYGRISDILHKIFSFFNQSAQLTCTNMAEPYLGEIKYYVLKDEYKFYDDLSGGEKSIALLCFILAVNKYFNAPFYFFDEIDSALDRTHMASLSEYLSSRNEGEKDDLFDNDQFICISLKKEFFKNADSLIGVYRSDSCSKILGYRLQD